MLSTAKQTNRRRLQQQDHGLSLWSDATHEEKKDAVELLSAKTRAGEPLEEEDEKKLRLLEAAMTTQSHVRRVHAAGLAVARINSGALTEDERQLHPDAALAQIFAAYEAAALCCSSRVFVFFHSQRLSFAAQALRVRQRVLTTAVEQVLNFASVQPLVNGQELTRRVPVILLGAFATRRRASSSFAMQRFITLLARRAIVVVCQEHCTTKVCLLLVLRLLLLFSWLSGFLFFHFLFSFFFLSVLFFFLYYASYLSRPRAPTHPAGLPGCTFTCCLFCGARRPRRGGGTGRGGARRACHFIISFHIIYFISFHFYLFFLLTDRRVSCSLFTRSLILCFCSCVQIVAV